MLLRKVARISLAQNSRALIHSSRICGQQAEEEQLVIKKANAGGLIEEKDICLIFLYHQ